jgi:DUF2075 family protein
MPRSLCATTPVKALSATESSSLSGSTDPGGISQVGCVYTAQGFEFDYVGVIFGTDLRYDPRSDSWVCDRSKSHDNGVKIAATEDDFLRLVKNVYRVLLTRGMKGCYVYFLDEDTRSFFESRIQHK